MTYHNPKTACGTYQKSELANLTPAQIVARLYQFLDQDLILAKKAIIAKERETQRERINHALAIIGELQANLNMEEGGEIAVNLSDLYLYLTTEITKANIKNDPASLENAIKTVTPLSEAWTELTTHKKEPEKIQILGARPKESAQAVAFQATF